MASEAVISAPLRLPNEAIKGFRPDAIGAQDTRGPDLSKYLKHLKPLKELGLKAIGRGPKPAPEPEPVDPGWNTAAAKPFARRDNPVVAPVDAGAPSPDGPPTPTDSGPQTPNIDPAVAEAQRLVEVRRQEARQSLDGILQAANDGTPKWEGEDLLRQDLPAGDSRNTAQAEAYRKVFNVLHNADASPFEIAQVSAYFGRDVRRSLYQDLYPNMSDEDLALKIVNSVPENGVVNRQAVGERINSIPHAEREALHVAQVSRAISELIKESAVKPATAEPGDQAGESQAEMEMKRQGARKTVERLLSGEGLPMEYGGLTAAPLTADDPHYVEQQASLKGLEYVLMLGATDDEIAQIAQSRFPNFRDIIVQDLARQGPPMPAEVDQPESASSVQEAREVAEPLTAEENARYARNNRDLIARIIGPDTPIREASSFKEVAATLNKSRRIKKWLKKEFETAEECARYFEGAVFDAGGYGGDTVGELWLVLGPEVRSAVLEMIDPAKRADVLGALRKQADVMDSDPDKYSAVDRSRFVGEVRDLTDKYTSGDTSGDRQDDASLDSDQAEAQPVLTPEKVVVTSDPQPAAEASVIPDEPIVETPVRGIADRRGLAQRIVDQATQVREAAESATGAVDKFKAMDVTAAKIRERQAKEELDRLEVEEAQRLQGDVRQTLRDAVSNQDVSMPDVRRPEIASTLIGRVRDLVDNNSGNAELQDEAVGVLLSDKEIGYILADRLGVEIQEANDQDNEETVESLINAGIFLKMQNQPGFTEWFRNVARSYNIEIPEEGEAN